MYKFTASLMNRNIHVIVIAVMFAALAMATTFAAQYYATIMDTTNFVRMMNTATAENVAAAGLIALAIFRAVKSAVRA